MSEKKDRPFVYAASLPRCATMSLKTALTELGFGPVNHMSSFVFNKPLINKWLPGLQNPYAADWRALLPGLGFGAACDAPTAHVSKYILRDIPEAKLILVYRDPEKWWVSIENTVSGNRGQGSWRMFWSKVMAFAVPGHAIYSLLRMQEYAGVHKKDVHGPGKMLEFQEEIKALNKKRGDPPMLEWEVKDGWGPLCEFLGVDVPDKPFPRMNDTATFQSRTRIIFYMGAAFWTLWLGLGSAGTYFGLKYWGLIE